MWVQRLEWHFCWVGCGGRISWTGKVSGIHPPQPMFLDLSHTLQNWIYDLQYYNFKMCKILNKNGEIIMVKKNPMCTSAYLWTWSIKIFSQDFIEKRSEQYSSPVACNKKLFQLVGQMDFLYHSGPYSG